MVGSKQQKEYLQEGGKESGSIANIYVKWGRDKKILINERITKMNKINDHKRFLDDILFLWSGTEHQLKTFIDRINDIGMEYGLTFKGEVEKNS